MELSVVTIVMFCVCPQNHNLLWTVYKTWTSRFNKNDTFSTSWVRYNRMKRTSPAAFARIRFKYLNGWWYSTYRLELQIDCSGTKSTLFQGWTHSLTSPAPLYVLPPLLISLISSAQLSSSLVVTASWRWVGTLGMLVLCPPVQLLTHFHCSHSLRHYRQRLRYLLHLTGSCWGNLLLTKRTLLPDFPHLMTGSVAAYQESVVEAVSKAPGWSHFHCRSQVLLRRWVQTLLLPVRTAQPVSGQGEWSVPCCSHSVLTSPVWRWQGGRDWSWRRTRPSLSDRCLTTRSCRWWDWLMSWTSTGSFYN